MNRLFLRIKIAAFLFLFFRLPSVCNAQSLLPDSLYSGDWGVMKVCYDQKAKKLSIVIDIEDDFANCQTLMLAENVKNVRRPVQLRVYYYGDTVAYKGTFYFTKGDKSGRTGTIHITTDNSDYVSCSRIANFKKGYVTDLDGAIHAYGTFSMVKSKKAICYATADLNGKRKGYFLSKDIVSIISEDKDLCQVIYLKKPKFICWVRKKDLIL
ncbi:hypothetical protein [Mucilaginibacter psychrotolerans]|uniref:WG repeat-containing protein n=1 Tax=Mucilaginibacter psychrotolerans TaxID=1524096 RepID=A0A4Y8S487_9SPHI|nr:hypothetical protein [Mucilaginibacter psychrotolerans]TFF33769.1 hypothetical protein E2R66_24550 [Mucilaginibacter psychrotolerans]